MSVSHICYADKNGLNTGAHGTRSALPAEAAAEAADAARPAAPLAATAEAFALTAGATWPCNRVRFASAVLTSAQEGDVKMLV